MTNAVPKILWLEVLLHAPFRLDAVINVCRMRSDLSLCSLVRSGREGRRCVFSLSEDG